MNVRTLKEVLMTTPPSTAEDSIYGRPKILDTSVIIDGRILDLLQTGFIEGKIIILILFWRSCAILRILRTA